MNRYEYRFTRKIPIQSLSVDVEQYAKSSSKIGGYDIRTNPKTWSELEENFNGSIHYFLKTGREVVGSLPVLKAAYLVPFKIKAWLDLTDRKNTGQSIDSKDIKKHRNDVFRIVPLINVAEKIETPKAISADIDAFLNKMPSETIDLKNLGSKRRTLESIIELYSNLYMCKK